MSRDPIDATPSPHSELFSDVAPAVLHFGEQRLEVAVAPQLARHAVVSYACRIAWSEEIAWPVSVHFHAPERPRRGAM